MFHPISPVHAEDPEGNKKFFGHIGVRGGFESNVFQKASNPRGDFFLSTEGSGHFQWKPTKKNTLFLDFLGSHLAYQRFNDANQFYIDGAFDLKHRLSKGIDLGISQLISFNDLKLLDTEGEPLPRNNIGSLNYQTRVYTTIEIGRDWVSEVGGGYRRKDMEETSGFSSLDLTTFFGDTGLWYFFAEKSFLRIKTIMNFILYDELNAGSAETSLPELKNPILELRRHDIKFKIYFREFSRMHIFGSSRFRYNEDVYENDLTYIQYEGMGRVKLSLFWDIIFDTSLAVRTRDYKVRAANVFFIQSTNQIFTSMETLQEEFMIFETSISREIWDHLNMAIRYVWMKKNTNAIGGDFVNSLGMFSLQIPF